MKEYLAEFSTHSAQRHSHLFLVGATEIERQKCECELRRRKAILGGSGDMLPLKIFKQTVRFRAFCDDFKQ